jgi:hypothetical protein
MYRVRFGPVYHFDAADESEGSVWFLLPATVWCDKISKTSNLKSIAEAPHAPVTGLKEVRNGASFPISASYQHHRFPGRRCNDNTGLQTHGKSRNPNPAIAPINARVLGKTYSEWSALWWQWALEQAASANPLLDTTGANCMSGQAGHDNAPRITTMWQEDSPGLRRPTVVLGLLMPLEHILTGMERKPIRQKTLQVVHIATRSNVTSIDGPITLLIHHSHHNAAGIGDRSYLRILLHSVPLSGPNA